MCKDLAKLFTFFLILGTVASCLPDDGTKNFVNVNKNVAPIYAAATYYSYDNFEFYQAKDTLWVSNAVYLKLYYGYVFDYEVSINGNTFVPFGNKQQQYVTISKSDLSSTNNVVSIKQRIKSGTGSLADRENTEYIEYTSHFVLTVDTAPFVPQITSVVLQDGTVKVTWKPYARSDFQSYEVGKIVEDLYGTYYQGFEIKNQSQTSFIDSTYVGGTTNYKIIVHNGSDNYSAPFAFSVPYSLNLKLEKNGTNFRLSWTAPPFYKNVKSYSAYFKNFIAYGNYYLETMKDGIPSQQMYLDIPGPVYFGYRLLSKVTLHPKVDNETTSRLSSADFAYLTYGTKIRNYNGRFLHDKNAPYYFCYAPTSASAGTLYRIGEDFIAIDSATVSTINYNSSLLISANGTHHYMLTNAIVKFDPATLNAIETTSFSSLNNGPFGIDFRNGTTTVSENNLIYFSGYESGAYPCVVDMNSKKVIFTSPNRTTMGHLSSDGTNLIIGSNLYTYSNNTYVQKSTLNYSNISFEQFIDNSPSQLLLITSSRLVIYNCATNTEDFSTSLPYGANEPYYDQVSDKIIYFDFQSKLFDVKTKNIKIVDVAQYYAYFLNNVFISPRSGSDDVYVLKDF